MNECLQLTYADVTMFALVEMLDEQFASVVDNFKKIRALAKRVAELPGVAEYLKTRPVTSF